MTSPRLRVVGLVDAMNDLTDDFDKLCAKLSPHRAGASRADDKEAGPAEPRWLQVRAAQPADH